MTKKTLYWIIGGVVIVAGFLLLKGRTILRGKDIGVLPSITRPGTVTELQFPGFLDPSVERPVTLTAISPITAPIISTPILSSISPILEPVIGQTRYTTSTSGMTIRYPYQPI